MKIIGHRGAAGLALENTIESIKEGISAGADYIEIDVRKTADHKLVLSHDPDLRRTYGVDLKIEDHKLSDLRIPCPNLPTLEEALGTVTVEGAIIELKEFIEPKRILATTQKFPNLDIRFASFNHHVIRAIKKHSPDSFCYVLEHHSPFEIVNKAHKMKADGLALNYGILNPLTYWLARRQKMHIYTYTLNRPRIARFFKILYPGIFICTDNPRLMKDLKR